MTHDKSIPEPDSPPQGKLRSAGELYPQVTPLRRQEVCSKLIVAHIAAVIAIGFVPILFPIAILILLPIAILTTLGVVVVCVMVITGPIYMPQLDFKRGVLEQWGIANKIAAVVILILSFAGYGFLIYWFFFRT